MSSNKDTRGNDPLDHLRISCSEGNVVATKVAKAAYEYATAEIDRLTAEVERLRANDQALRDAGLLDENGNLRKPDCYWRSADESAVENPHDDMSFHADVGDVEWYRPAWGGTKQWWTKTKDLASRGPFDTREAAERVANRIQMEATDAHG